jgi:hypothetical protein
LDIYPNHAEALYGLGVLTLEKLDYDISCRGLNDGVAIGVEVRSALGFFDTVIVNDTSRRGDTTGLAHRSSAICILQYFKELEAGRSVDKLPEVPHFVESFRKTLLRCRNHFNEVCTVLASSVALDLHVVEYCTLLQDALRIHDHHPCTNMWLQTRIEYSNHLYNVLNRVALQSQFSNGQDRTIMMLQVETFAECLEFFADWASADARDAFYCEHAELFAELRSNCKTCFASITHVVLASIGASSTGNSGSASGSDSSGDGMEIMGSLDDPSQYQVVSSASSLAPFPGIHLTPEEVDLLANAATMGVNLIKLDVVAAHAGSSTAVADAAELLSGVLSVHFAVCFNRQTATSFSDFADSLLYFVGLLTVQPELLTAAFTEHASGLWDAVSGQNSAASSMFRQQQVSISLLVTAKYLFCRALLAEPPTDCDGQLLNHCSQYIASIGAAVSPPGGANSSVCSTEENEDRMTMLYNLAVVCFKMNEIDQCEFHLKEYARLQVVSQVGTLKGVRDELLADEDFQQLQSHAWFQQLFEGV